MTATGNIAPRSWLIAPLGELCNISIGRTPARNRSDYWGPGSPWLSIADMNQGRDLAITGETITDVAVRECNCRAVPAGTVLLSFKLSIGKVGIATRSLFTNEAIAALPITNSSTLLPEFLYWALRSIDLTLGLDRAAKGLTLNRDKLERIQIPLPPLSEQRRIVEILDKADALRAKRRSTVAQIDILTQSIFLEMFGDPAANPKGFEKRRVGDVVSRITNGFVGPTRNIYQAAGVPYLLARHVKANELTFDGKTFISEAFNRKNVKSVLKRDDVLLVQSGHTGESAVVTPEHEGHNCHAMIVLTPRPELLSGHFLSHAFETAAMQRAFKGIQTGITLAHLNCRDVRELSIPIPPLTLQREFARCVMSMVRLKSAQRSSLAQMDALFASLQHRAFRGELSA